MDPLDRLIKERIERELQAKTRRHFIKNCVSGMGGLALGSFFMSCDSFSGSGKKGKIALTERDINPLASMSPPFPAKVKSVIYLHMAGAPSQLEMFDYQPELLQLDGQVTPQSLLEGKQFAFIRGTPIPLGPSAGFKQEGEARN